MLVSLLIKSLMLRESPSEIALTVVNVGLSYKVSGKMEASRTLTRIKSIKSLQLSHRIKDIILKFRVNKLLHFATAYVYASVSLIMMIGNSIFRNFPPFKMVTSKFYTESKLEFFITRYLTPKKMDMISLKLTNSPRRTVIFIHSVVSVVMQKIFTLRS